MEKERVGMRRGKSWDGRRRVNGREKKDLPPFLLYVKKVEIHNTKVYSGSSTH